MEKGTRHSEALASTIGQDPAIALTLPAQDPAVALTLPARVHEHHGAVHESDDDTLIDATGRRERASASQPLALTAIFRGPDTVRAACLLLCAALVAGPLYVRDAASWAGGVLWTLWLMTHVSALVGLGLRARWVRRWIIAINGVHATTFVGLFLEGWITMPALIIRAGLSLALLGLACSRGISEWLPRPPNRAIPAHIPTR